MAALISSLSPQLSTLFQLFCCCLVTEVNKLHCGFCFLAAVSSVHMFLSAARSKIKQKIQFCVSHCSHRDALILP